MKLNIRKIFFFGSFGISMYTGGISNTSIPELFDKRKNYIDAKNSYIDAQELLHIAQLDYDAAIYEVDYSEKIIADAKCYIKNSNRFKQWLEDKCSSDNPFDDSLNVLKQKYGIELVFLSDVTVESTGSGSNYVCHGIGNAHWCNSGTYFFPKYTNQHRGATAHGDGSKLMLDCGQFSYGLMVTADTQTTITPWHSSFDPLTWRITRQIRDEYFKSMVNCKLFIEGSKENSTIIYKLDHDQQNLAFLVRPILYDIMQQCAAMRDSLKSNIHYKSIEKKLKKILPKLLEDRETKKIILDRAKEYESKMHQEFNKKSDTYNEALAWIISLLVFPNVLGAYVLQHAYKKYAHKDMNIDCENSNMLFCFKAKNDLQTPLIEPDRQLPVETEAYNSNRQGM